MSTVARRACPAPHDLAAQILMALPSEVRKALTKRPGALTAGFAAWSWEGGQIIRINQRTVSVGRPGRDEVLRSVR